MTFPNTSIPQQNGAHRRSHPFVVSLFLWLLIAASLTASETNTVSRASGESAKELATKHITDGWELAHPVIEGRFGAGTTNIVAIQQPQGSTPNHLGIGIWVPTSTSDYRKYWVPDAIQMLDTFEIRVESVFFATANRAPLKDLLVLYSYHRNGSTDDDGFGTAALGWDGKSFTLLPVGEKLSGLKNAAAVKKKLKQLGYN